MLIVGYGGKQIITNHCCGLSALAASLLPIPHKPHTTGDNTTCFTPPLAPFCEQLFVRDAILVSHCCDLGF